MRPVHQQDRKQLAAQVGSLLSKDNIIAIMFKSSDSWDRIAFFIRRAIKAKERKGKRNEKKSDRLRNTAFYW